MGACKLLFNRKERSRERGAERWRKLRGRKQNCESSEDDPAYEITDLEEVSDIESVVSEQDRQVMEASEIILDDPEKDAYITGTVYAEADGYGAFMIPYEKG